jgi:hypothetical protein
MLVIWGVLAGGLVVEIRKRQWTAAAFSGVLLAALTYIMWPIFRYLAGVVASWF